MKWFLIGLRFAAAGMILALVAILMVERDGRAKAEKRALDAQIEASRWEGSARASERALGALEGLQTQVVIRQERTRENVSDVRALEDGSDACLRDPAVRLALQRLHEAGEADPDVIGALIDAHLQGQAEP